MMDIIALESQHTSGVYPKRPIAIVRGQGVRVWDAEGREYIDCVGGHGVVLLGHAHPAIAAAVTEQASRLVTCPEIFYNDQRARLLARLTDLAPQGLDRTFLCNSGAEAVEGAIKFARVATGRTDIVACMRGFHGRTLGALSATWKRDYRRPFQPLVPGFQHIPFDDLEAVDRAITDETAAVLVEIVQGEGGVRPGSIEFFQRLRRLCDERGALLIVDEVQTGLGRTGRWFACEHHDLAPDIMTLGKGLAGGVPMGAVLFNARVAEKLRPGLHGSTFGGNPLACAAALATLDTLEAEDLPSQAAHKGAYLLDRLRDLSSPRIREVRGLGLMVGIELRERVQPYLQALMNRGVLALPAGDTVLRLLPPLVVSFQELDAVIEAIAEVLSDQGDQGGRGQGDGEPGTKAESLPLSPSPSPLVSDKWAEELLRRMVEIESLSGREEKLAAFLVGEMARCGFTRAYVDRVGNAVGEMGEPDAERTIVLLGHMDTVPGRVPVRLEGGRLYGRGAVDAKGPLAAFIAAVAGLGPRPGVRYVVVGAVEEESASSRGARFIRDRFLAEGEAQARAFGQARNTGERACVSELPAACIIGEPSGWDAITLGYKGRLLVDYVAERPAGHTARPGDHGITAQAVSWWLALTRYADGYNAGRDGLFRRLLPSLRGIWTEGDGLRERVTVRVSLRLPPDVDVDALQGMVRGFAGDGPGVSLRFYGYEPAYRTEKNTPLVRALVAAIRAEGGRPTFTLKTGTSDMNVVGPAWGCPMVAYGPGDSRLDHTPEEHIELAEYLRAIRVLRHALEFLSKE